MASCPEIKHLKFELGTVDDDQSYTRFTDISRLGKLESFKLKFYTCGLNAVDPLRVFDNLLPSVRTLQTYAHQI